MMNLIKKIFSGKQEAVSSPAPVAQPQAGEQQTTVIVDETFFRKMISNTKMLVILAVGSPILGVLFLLTSIWFITYGKGSDYIVFMDAGGRPVMIGKDYRDTFYQAETEAFLADAVRDIFSWDFIETQTPNLFGQRAERLANYFTPEFFEAFMPIFTKVYIHSITDSRSTIKASISEITDIKIEGKYGTFIVNVDFRKIYAEARYERTEEGKQRRITEERYSKSYTLGLQKGDRKVANPFGIYIFRVVDNTVQPGA
ncbi:MAG: hypothetical protein DDT19_00006 [Syntrophomonadaceae bacterium]|nr:hypothetical protein [Bacillota bacterium]